MKTIDGIMLKQMIISGANYLYNCYPEVDALNVFPVPDGDTGTNMNLTMQSGAKEVENKTDKGVYEIAKAFSKGLLMGARGNSGVILSQIFRGFAMSLQGKETINAVELSKALSNGREVAYKAVMKPVEGTILTVIKDSTKLLETKVNAKMDIEKAFEIFYQEARESLLRTPDLLPVLKEVGVVDSGGMGLCKVLHGFKKALKGIIVEKNAVTSVTEKESSNVEATDEYGYCVEFVMNLPEEPTDVGKKMFVEKKFNSFLESHGNSIIYKKEGQIVKVHLHTVAPGGILTYGQQFGEFNRVKVENLSLDHTEMNDFSEEVKDEPLKEYALIACCAGDGIADKFKEYGVDEVVSGGQTMNPSTEDFVAAIKKVHAKKVIILPNNSNIVLAAQQAADVYEDAEVKVIQAKTIPQGFVACMMFNPEASLEENVNEMTEAIANVKSGQVTFAIKDTNIDGVDIKKDQYIGINGKTIICCYPNKVKAAYKMISSMLDETSSIITLIVGEDATSAEVDALTELISNKYPDIEIEITEGKQPVYSFIVGVE